MTKDKDQATPVQNPLADQIALERFAESLIKEKNSPHVTKTTFPKIKKHLVRQLTDAINAQLIGLLDENSQLELASLLEEKATDDQIDDFFVQRIPDITSEITKVLLDFRKGYLAPLELPKK